MAGRKKKKKSSGFGISIPYKLKTKAEKYVKTVFDKIKNKVSKTLSDKLFLTMMEAAPKLEQYMRKTAKWDDDFMPQREYLKAMPYVSKDGKRMGLYFYYDLKEYKKANPNEDINAFNFGYRHETFYFPHAGYISIILPYTPYAVLNESKLNEIWTNLKKAVYRHIKSPYKEEGYKHSIRHHAVHRDKPG
jgi:hypothetical protein